MKKNKKELLILIVLIFIGINYSLYSLYMTPKLNKAVEQKKIYEQKQNELFQIYDDKRNLTTVKSENLKLAEKAKELDNLTVKYSDTPQLVYDFYTACKKYGIKGDSVTFNSSSSAQDAVTQSPQSSNDSGNNQKNMPIKDLTKVNINLKVEGDKDKIEVFLRNLKTISSFRLNVGSISIAALEDQSELYNSQSALSGTPSTEPSNEGTVLPDNGYSTPQTGVGAPPPPSDNALKIPPSQGLSANNKGFEKNTDSPPTHADQMSVEIVFFQYIIQDDKSLNRSNNYDFYNGKNGFDSIAKMIQ